MPAIDVHHAASDAGPGELDLGPLAWVIDELRKSLGAAVKAMRRFVRDADAARAAEIDALDASPLRIARQQLHQACGALEMVGMASPALLLHAMEAAVQKFVRRPEACSGQAAAVIEHASFALIEYLETVLAGKPASPVALFPQYREVQQLAGAERIHPADLWPVERRFREPEGASDQIALPYGAPARARLDAAVLRIVKSGDREAALSLRNTCLGLAAAQTERQARSFWKICAAFFEAFAAGLLPADIYVKRVASRALMQYASLAKGDAAIADRLLQDLLFFCAQAGPLDPAAPLPWLRAVRQAFALERCQPTDYETVRFGRFDPALLVQARKRIASATDTWSALAGGERNKLKPALDQFGLVCDSLRKLHPGSEALAQALTRALDATLASGEPPSATLAMEVATAVLYLQAAFEELDTAEEQMRERASRLAQRLDAVGAVGAGAQSEPLEHWMEELYRRVSGEQTMGSVVDELRSTLAEVEKALDQFFRNPGDSAVLAQVPEHLVQMRGVLSVLGLDQAVLAVLRMRESVEHWLAHAPPPPAESQGVFERFGSSLGALGFLIDMLGYQRSMARKLFVYDEELGELRILTGKARVRASDAGEKAGEKIEKRGLPPAPEAQALPPLPAPAPAPMTAAAPVFDATELLPLAQAPGVSPAPSPTPPTPAITKAPSPPAPAPPVPIFAPAAPADDELLGVFLDEAREVVRNGLDAVDAISGEPGNLDEQLTLRRAFHTLKGSSRMVGLADFGEAAWALEQALNVWLAEQKPMPPGLLQLSREALRAFARWADAIAAGDAQDWTPQAFRQSADAMRLDGSWLPLALPGSAPLLPIDEPAPASEKADEKAGEKVDEERQRVPGFADFPAATMPPLASDAPSDQTPERVAESAEEIDFSVFAAAMNEPPASPAEALPPLPPLTEPLAPSTPESVLTPEPVFEPQPIEAPEPVSAQAAAPTPEAPAEIDASPAPMAAEAASASVSDDGVKVIDGLRIGLPLYNVYLSEADEWSRRLLVCLQEWSLELHQRLPDAAVAFAHSLAGSSATVGFKALSELARLLEHALQHAQLQSVEVAGQAAQTFVAAADEIRRLLHQLAAGFLKAPEQELLDRLQQILQTEIASSLFFLGEESEEPPAQSADPLSEFAATEALALGPAAPPFTAPEPAAPEPVAPEAAAPVPAPTGPVAPALSATQTGREQRIDDAIARAVGMGGDADDDIDAIDVIDPDLFPIFEEEAAELLPQLGGALRQWASRPENLGARSEVLRALHTLKGSSRLAGAMRLGEMAHRLESVIEQLDAASAGSAQIEPLQASVDALQANFDALRAIGQSPADTVVSLPQRPEAPGEQAAAAPDKSPAPAALQAAAAPLHAPAQLLPPRVVVSQSVRVRVQLLDRLINQAGEVMISRSRLDVHLGQFRASLTDLSGNLDRLRQQLRDVELQAESQMQSRLALSKDSTAGFDPLEFDRFTRVQELTRMMAESVNDVATVQRNLQRSMESAEDDLIAQGRQARELQRDLLRTRMVEFEGIAERLYAVVRQSSKETGKQIKLDITGGAIEMDRGVLDRMTPAFEHLLRNCVAHGIEEPQARAAAGKSAIGTITVALQYEGNDVSVEFRDDGAGLDLPRIRAKALAQGILAPEANLSDAEAAHLIFMPGFSTAAEVTGLSGRGIGMDVVRTEINALGGRIETSTVAGQGAAFRMVLPLTTAVTQVLMLRAGDLTIGVPANIAEVVRRTPLADLQEAYRTGSIDDGAEKLPFFWSGALLQASARSTETAGKTRPVLIFRSASQRVALHVDEVLGNQEVVVKNLGPQLSRLPGLAGMSVLASGAVVLIYNPVALATVYGDQVRAGSAGPLPEARAQGAGGGKALVAAPLAGPSQVPLVLVVDDSITVRRVTQRLLQREGYRVALAADGLQALERLQEERPTVVLSDIEMPRMDGFDLARNIRADGALRDLPIIMITSRIAQKHREHAIELGVNHYLGKPYSDEELLSLIRHYARIASEV